MKSAEDQSIPTALTFINYTVILDWVGEVIMHVYCTYLRLLSQSHCVCVSKYIHVMYTQVFLVSVNGSTNYCTGGAHTHGEI